MLYLRVLQSDWTAKFLQQVQNTIIIGLRLDPHTMLGCLVSQPYFALFQVGGARGRENAFKVPSPSFEVFVSPCSSCQK